VYTGGGDDQGAGDRGGWGVYPASEVESICNR